MSGPFKMKGSPMQRNFGISPAKDTEGVVHEHPHLKKKKKKGEEKMSQAMKEAIAAVKKESIEKANIELAKQGKPPVTSDSLDKKTKE